jgi:hypothetical protein
MMVTRMGLMYSLEYVSLDSPRTALRKTYVEDWQLSSLSKE